MSVVSAWWRTSRGAAWTGSIFVIFDARTGRQPGPEESIRGVGHLARPCLSNEHPGRHAQLAVIVEVSTELAVAAINTLLYRGQATEASRD